MSNTSEAELRRHLAKALDWEEAHVGLVSVSRGFPPDLRGEVPAGLPHSAWGLMEHLRLAQRDLLEFCCDEAYRPMEWPADYWPRSPAPPDEAAWDGSLADYLQDLEALRAHVLDPDVDLLAPVPTGTKAQTHLRSVLLVVDHTAYHVGQLVTVRRALGIWPPDR